MKISKENGYYLMHKNIYIVFLLVFFGACTSNTIYKKPKNLIPKDSMLLLLKDMYVASSAKYVKNKKGQKEINYLAFVYEKYKIDSTRFIESNVYYTSRFEQYNEMLQEIKKRLEKERDSLEYQIQLKDSLSVSKKADTLKPQPIDSLLQKEIDTKF